MAKLLGCVETDELWGHGHFVPLKVSMANLNRSVSCENLSFTLYTLICNMVTHECCLADIYLLITVVICCSYFNTCDLLQACGKLLCVWRLTWCMQTVSIGGSMIWNPGFVCVYAVYVFQLNWFVRRHLILHLFQGNSKNGITVTWSRFSSIEDASGPQWKLRERLSVDSKYCFVQSFNPEHMHMLVMCDPVCHVRYVIVTACSRLP